MVMEKLILCKKNEGTEFNSSEEEKFLRRLNQNRVPALFVLVIWVVGHYLGCWPYKVPGQMAEEGAKSL